MTESIRFAEVNGTRLGYQIRRGAGSGTPLVFVHGYALRATSDVYGPLLDLLAREFTVFALDIRGHGASSGATADWTLPAIADDIAAFAREVIDDDNLIYVGHSIGGFLGMLAEIRHPKTFASLALLATAAAIGGRENPPEVATAFADHGRDRETMAATLGPMYARTMPNDLRNAVDAATLIDRRVHEAFFPHFAELAIEDRLGEIRPPVLVLSGRRDVVVSVEEQHRTASQLADCKEVIFSSEGHMLPIEVPQLAAHEILTFFFDNQDLRGRPTQN